ncbi:hypothetical protein V5O48_015843 [Marasmius crinis-equi]|uniref:Uncharacterized protein n=1 Tax=Marasmius crinis-equi TaxID=585013 RepID=A0ABR3ETI3_9AGAR
MRALTESTIKAAFAKTGIWPFNPAAVTPNMMAPSKETSLRGSLPIPELSPVHTVSNMLVSMNERVQKWGAENSPSVTLSSRRSTQRTQLESDTPMSVRSQALPDPFDTLVHDSVDALQQLEAQEEAKKRASASNQLMGDGLPRLLTCEDFVKRVKAFAAAAKEKERGLKERRASKQEVKEAQKEYDTLVAQRKRENQKAHDLWVADKDLWAEEKRKAGKATRPQPLWRNFKLPPIPKLAILQSKAKELEASANAGEEEGGPGSDAEAGKDSELSGSSENEGDSHSD